ncbi:MAG: ABC transporter permease [Planctomycetes bacterium]|nr:ABC transporter permease [Planctomycetota bacterium]
MSPPPTERAGPVSKAATLALPVAWAALLLLLPLVVMVVTSTGSRPPSGGVQHDGSLQAWSWIASRGELVSRTAWRSARIAGVATLLCVLLATPTAWWIARAPLRRRALLLLLVVVPSWTSFLLRTYAWKILLRTEGPVNELLGLLGAGPVSFLNTEGAVVVGLVYGYLPFAVLPIYVAVERLDRDLLHAARDLGAGPVRTFVSVAFPLTLAGTVAGAMLVFVPSLAAFVTPALLGGDDTYMVGQLTQDQFMKARDWPLGSALGAALAAAALLALLPVALAKRVARA